jgi:hydrogenase-4 component B
MFFIGAAGACALPPCNAFISEFLIYLGLFHTLGLPKEVALPAVAFVIPAMALSGAFAIACFTKAYGIVFLGSPRQALPHEPHDPHWPIRLPLGILATLVVCLGVVPSAVAPSLNGVCAAWSGLLWDAELAAKALDPLAPLGWTMIALIIALLAGFGWLYWQIAQFPYSEGSTWGCGYLAPTPRLQYTGTSLTQFLVSMFGWSIQPIEIQPKIRELFPTSAVYWSKVPEIVLDRVVSPLVDALARRMLWFRLFQQGSVQIYLLYIVAMLVVLFTAF